jgi:hypothetical protein
LDVISICLNNKTDFSAEVVKESMLTLQGDLIPPFALMRTAILSSQSFPEMKKFVLTDTIPSMLKKKVWEIAPKVWEGVIFGLKNLVTASNKFTDETFQALLTIPGVQLKSILKVASNITPLIAQFCKNLSREEKEMNLTTSDNDRNKIIRDLLQS